MGRPGHLTATHPRNKTTIYTAPRRGSDLRRYRHDRATTRARQGRRFLIAFEQVSKRYADGTEAVEGLDLTIKAGELTVLVGPSGCGKTTTLRMINRLETVSSGRITVEERPIGQLDAIELRRGIGYVMQHSGLFPHRTVFDNIATVPRLLGWKKHAVRERVHELIDTVGLSAAMAKRYPHQLSGGQQQRVGVARALAADPPILLMDEPFAAVDPIVRRRLQDELLDLQARLRKTIVFVTHDIDEAIRLGDRIAIFVVGGRLAQFDTPARLLAAPADDFVADFLGRDRELKRLALLRVVDAPRMQNAPIVIVGERASGDTPAESAWIVHQDDAGALIGWQGRDSDEPARFDETVGHDTSLDRVLAAALRSPIGAVPVIDPNGRLDGLIGPAELRRALTQ